jgi:hypothetical protein
MPFLQIQIVQLEFPQSCGQFDAHQLSSHVSNHTEQCLALILDLRIRKTNSL